LKQSPVALPNPEALDNIKDNMSFNYNEVAKEDLEMVFSA